MNLIRDFNFSSAIGNFYQSAQTFASNLTDQQKRVAIVATAAIALFAIGYCIYKRCTFKASEQQQQQLPVTPVKDPSLNSSEVKKDATETASVVPSLVPALPESEEEVDAKASSNGEGTAEGSSSDSEVKRNGTESAPEDKPLEIVLAEGEEKVGANDDEMVARATSSGSIVDEERRSAMDPKTPSREHLINKIKKQTEQIEKLEAAVLDNPDDTQAHNKLEKALERKNETVSLYRAVYTSNN